MSRTGWAQIWVVMVLTLTACTGGEPDNGDEADSSAPSGSGEPEPESALVGAPDVGACRDLDGPEAFAELSADGLVPCDGPHNSRVVEVVELPDGVTPTSSIDELSQVDLDVCVEPAAELLGGSADERRTSLFYRAFFVPDPEQQAEGASWLACDVYAASDLGVLELPDTEPYLAEADVRERFTKCVRLNDDDSTLVVGCDREHTVETADVLEFPTLEAAESGDLSEQCRTAAGPDADLSVGFLRPEPSTFDVEEVFVAACLLVSVEGVTG